MEILIVYSEYSKQCKKFMSVLNSDQVIDINKFNKLCIDNPTIRAFIKDKKNTDIKRVPTVIVKTGNDTAMYEGIEAFDWLDSFSQQLYDQINDAAMLAEEEELKKKAEIEEKARQIALEHIRQQQERDEQAAQQAAKSASMQPHGSVKQQAKMIANDRSNLTFHEQINTNDKPDAGTSHVTQVKTGDPVNVTELVKRMEKEREMEEQEIQKKKHQIIV